jgi:hypothetical protein
MKSISQISLFANAFADGPEKAITLADFLDGVKSGRWKTPVENVQGARQHGLGKIRQEKRGLPAVSSPSIAYHAKADSPPLKRP